MQITIAKSISKELITIFIFLPNLSEIAPKIIPKKISAIHLNPTIKPAIAIIISFEYILPFIDSKNGVIVAIAKPFDVKEDENLKRKLLRRLITLPRCR